MYCTSGRDHNIYRQWYFTSLVYRSTTVYESKNYYNIAHELKEDVKQQPNILVGGTLKEYQVSCVVKFN